jgi:hypothetical protein
MHENLRNEFVSFIIITRPQRNILTNACSFTPTGFALHQRGFNGGTSATGVPIIAVGYQGDRSNVSLINTA